MPVSVIVAELIKRGIEADACCIFDRRDVSL